MQVYRCSQNSSTEIDLLLMRLDSSSSQLSKLVELVTALNAFRITASRIDGIVTADCLFSTLRETLSVLNPATVDSTVAYRRK